MTKKYEYEEYEENILNCTVTYKEDYVLIGGIIPGGSGSSSVDTEFETRIYNDGEVETCHRGIGRGFIWTDWYEGYLWG